MLALTMNYDGGLRWRPRDEIKVSIRSHRDGALMDCSNEYEV